MKDQLLLLFVIGLTVLGESFSKMEDCLKHFFIVRLWRVESRMSISTGKASSGSD